MIEYVYKLAIKVISWQKNNTWELTLTTMAVEKSLVLLSSVSNNAQGYKVHHYFTTTILANSKLTSSSILELSRGNISFPNNFLSQGRSKGWVSWYII